MLTDDLAELSDVAVELGLEGPDDMSDSQIARAKPLISRVSYLFASEAQRDFVPGTSTNRLKVRWRSPLSHMRGAYVTLTENPTTVHDIVDDDGIAIPAANYKVDGKTIAFLTMNYPRYIYQFYGGTSPYTEFVTVTYTHDDPIPAGVKQAVAAIVARYIALPDTTGSTTTPAVTSLNAGGGIIAYRVQYADWVSQSVKLTDEDKAMAWSYRDPATLPIVVGT